MYLFILSLREVCRLMMWMQSDDVDVKSCVVLCCVKFLEAYLHAGKREQPGILYDTPVHHLQPTHFSCHDKVPSE